MGRVVFNMSVSLDGRVATREGSLEWIAVDEPTHRLFNDEARAVGAFLMGRRMYELLQAFWPTADAGPPVSPAIADFAQIWRRKPKYVFSTTLREVDATATLVTEVTRDSITRIKNAVGADVSVGGPTPAAALMRLGLVDDLVMYVNPVVLGGGPPFLPPLAEAMKLRLSGAETLASGVVRLGYSRA